MHRTITWSVVAAVCWLTVGAKADLNKGLIAAWTFDDGTARDSVGASNGKFVDGAKAVDGGRKGKALSVDGAKAHVSIPHTKAFDPLANAMTVSVWAFVRAGKDHSAVAWKGDKIGWGANYLFRIATTSNTGLTWGSCPAGVEGWFATNGALKANEWVHLCFTADGKTLTAYVNATMPNATDNGPNPKPVAGPYLTFPEKPMELGVGRAVGGNVGADAFLDGLIDEVYIYNRALDAAEVRDLAGDKAPSLAVRAHDKLATQWATLKR
jgi:hypothetical protein